LTTGEFLVAFIAVLLRSILTVPRRVHLIKDEEISIAGSKKSLRRTLRIKARENGSMRGRVSVLSFPTMAVRTCLSITRISLQRGSGLYMTARRWSTKLDRVRKALKQPTCIPADLNAGMPRIVKTTGPTEWWGFFVLGRVKSFMVCFISYIVNCRA